MGGPVRDVIARKPHRPPARRDRSGNNRHAGSGNRPKCHPVIVEYVKQRALSRRDFFRGTAAAGALAPRPLLAQGATRIVDVTHTLTHAFPTYFGQQQFVDEDVFTFARHSFNLKKLRVNEHTGTHFDAPLHFTDGGAAVDAVPVESLVCPLVIVDIRARAEADPDARVTPDDLRAWIAAHGPIPAGA